MARRRYQRPTPYRRGSWWKIRLRQDEFVGGKLKRTQKEIRIAPASMGEREVRKVLDEYLRPMNQGLEGVGSAVNFRAFVESTYVPLMTTETATTTQGRYRGIIKNYLVPAFGSLALRELTTLRLQKYFSALATSPLARESRDKIRDVMSAIMGTALRTGFLATNPMDGVRLPRQRRGQNNKKLYITPKQAHQLVALVPEPYATMMYVAAYTGMRASEVIGLRWNDIEADYVTHQHTIMVDERYCRGDWDEPKSECSNAPISVPECVIERINRLRLLTVEVRAGNAVRKYKVVKSDGPTDLVFQSVQKGRPMRDNNVLTRHIKPAARKLGLGFVNWQCLRRSYATWLKMAGADIKDAQAQMRHSRASTTMDVYQQFVPESQHRVVERLGSLA